MASLVRTACRLVPLILLGGCAVSRCDEFAAPLDRAPSSCPPRPAAAADPPPGEPPVDAPRYCYATLGQPDCYAAPVRGRGGYLGLYAPPPVPAPPAAAQ